MQVAIAYHNMRQVGHFIPVLCIDQLKSARGHLRSILNNLKSNYFSNKEDIFQIKKIFLSGQVEEAVVYFKQLGEVDPYRLDNLDTYSNLLYVKEQRVELAHLAHKTNMIDK